MEKRSVTVVGPDPDGLFWITLEAGENRISVPVSSIGAGFVGEVMKAFTNQPALTNQHPTDHLRDAADQIQKIVDSVTQPVDEHVASWHAVADALDAVSPGWNWGDAPAADQAVGLIKALANQASMAKLGVVAIANELKAAGWRPPAQSSTVVVMSAPTWARVLLADNYSNYFWAADFAHGARFESVSGHTGGILDLDCPHAWRLIATAEPITQH